MINYSVIIPYKDRPTLLKKALDSIPDREDIQIIVINNNYVPFDNVCDLSRRNSPVLLLEHPEGGPGGARNEGMKHATGLYSVFCDSDDYFIEGAFDTFDKCIGQGYDIVFFRMDSINLTTGKRESRHLSYERLLLSFFENGEEASLRFKWSTACGKLYNTAMLRQNKVRFGNLGGEDILFSAIAGHYASTIAARKERVYMITSGGTKPSLTERYRLKDWLNKYKSYEEKRQFMRSVGRSKFVDSRLRIAMRLSRECVGQNIRRIKSLLWLRLDELKKIKHKFDKFYFEVHIVDHCNLNCASCSHFAPLAEPHFCDINLFKKDISRMKELFPGKQVKRIRLLGGEPLLHPGVSDFICLTAAIFPEAERSVVTNGILLPKMGDEFWEVIKSTRTSICVSKYPIALEVCQAVKSMH